MLLSLAPARHGPVVFNGTCITTSQEQLDTAKVRCQAGEMGRLAPRHTH